jgi:SAM-dependent methyltransferase
VSGFSADWLSLREPYDVAARSPDVFSAVIDAFDGKPDLRVVDLGCGTGSTLRTLAPRLGAGQNWRLVDHDRRLLDRASQSARALNVLATPIEADLNRDIEALLGEPADLVAMSALLDLVSAEWLDRFANAVAQRGLSVYAALSYDGRIEIAPAYPLDGKIVNAVNLHQLSDKGFGPALGPSAAAAAIDRLKQRGYSAHQAPVDWVASKKDAAFQLEIIRGWAAAARETGAVSMQDADAWLAFRESEIAAGRSSLRVGHVDFFAVPPSAA